MECLQIQGGEPFLYTDLDKLIMYCQSSGKAQQIMVATNGLVSVKTEMFQILRENHVIVRISDYAVDKERALAFYRQCKAQGVAVTYYEFGTENGKWFLLGGGNNLYSEDDAETEEKFQSCSFNICLTLEDKKLVYCSRAVNAADVQGFEMKKGDYVLASKDNNKFADELRRFVSHPHFMEACRYCRGTHMDILCQAGEQ